MTALPATHPTAQDSLPLLVDALVSGGDNRIALDGTGRNRYGRGPEPTSAAHCFASSTASTISPSAFAQASAVHARLARALAHLRESDVHDAEMELLRQRLTRLLGWSNQDAPHLVFAPSGTDAHFHAASLCAFTGKRPLLVITVERSETGSGIPQAIEGLETYHHSVAARDAQGHLRSDAAICDEIDALIAGAMKRGHAVLLVVADVSKSGLISPSLSTAFMLRDRWGALLQIMIDGCQFRMSRETLRSYVAKDCIVALTGSKFMTGPAFSGVLVIPRSIGHAMITCSLAGFAASGSRRGDWPAGFLERATLPSASNFGLLLRWTAALTEMEAFFALDEDVVKTIVTGFDVGIRRFVAQHPRLTLLDSRSLDRTHLWTRESWDATATIFPILFHAADGSLLGADATMRLFQMLSATPAIEIGQPVQAGAPDGVPVTALRLCLSARQIVTAASVAEGPDRLITAGRQCLETAAALAATMA